MKFINTSNAIRLAPYRSLRKWIMGIDAVVFDWLVLIVIELNLSMDESPSLVSIMASKIYRFQKWIERVKIGLLVFVSSHVLISIPYELYCSAASCCTLYSNFSTLTSLSLSSFIHILKFTLQRLFVSSYLFNTTCFGLIGHHEVYKIVNENCCFFDTLFVFSIFR
jgi:hypothetical protein